MLTENIFISKDNNDRLNQISRGIALYTGDKQGDPRDISEKTKIMENVIKVNEYNNLP